MSKCNNCNKEIGLFSREYSCANCGKIYCGDCISQIKPSDNDVYVWIIGDISEYDYDCRSGWNNKYRLCPNCMKQFNSQYDFLKNADISSVKTFSINYLGKKPNSSKYKEYETSFYKQREDAVFEIKKCAKLLHSNCIIDLSFTKGKGQSGNYEYSTWSASGKILL